MAYSILPFTPTPDRAGVLSHIMRSLAQFETIFSDYHRVCDAKCFECDQCQAVLRVVAAMLANRDARAWEVWDLQDSLEDTKLVGILYVSAVIPGVDAQAHYAFFDGRLQDKTPILEEMIQWVFEDHPDEGWRALERLTIEVPDYAFALAKHANRKLGFGGDFQYTHRGTTIDVEGVRQSTIRWRGQPRSTLLLGRLRTPT